MTHEISCIIWLSFEQTKPNLETHMKLNLTLYSIMLKILKTSAAEWTPNWESSIEKGREVLPP